MILRLLRGSGPPTADTLRDDIRKMCSVFLHRERDAAIVATKFKDQLYFEADDAIQETATAPGDAFGTVVRDAFLASRRRALPKRGERVKSKDWPAFKVSKAKSVAQFEREWICVTVYGMNEANIMVRLETDPVSDEVNLTKICNPLVVERLGGDIRLLKKKFLLWEAK